MPLCGTDDGQGHGDQKFVLDMNERDLQQLSSASSRASELYSQTDAHITSEQPSTLGYASTLSQSAYYLGDTMSPDEIATITTLAEQHGVQPENTRILKRSGAMPWSYDVLCASVEGKRDFIPPQDTALGKVAFVLGDHSIELSKICESLTEARDYAGDDKRAQYLSLVIGSLQNGNMEQYKESQRLWVEDQRTNVESIIGFVEPYRDPHGVRAEFEGVVGIVHGEETRLLKLLVENAGRFVGTLPWVVRSGDVHGNGPFEGDGIGYCNFSSLHSTLVVAILASTTNAQSSFSLLQYIDLPWDQSAQREDDSRRSALR